MVNKTILIGNLGNDPEQTNLESGKVLTKFSLATSKKVGEEYKTTWHNIIMWNKTAEIAAKYLKKGSKVYLEGEIDNRSYDDKEGNKRYVSDVVCYQMQMLDKKGEGEENEMPY